MPIKNINIQPFAHCPALDGYHCQTNSLAKMYYYYSHPLSEDMIFGLGAGMGFIYWQMKMGEARYIFIGGRGNNKSFFNDLGKRTGVQIRSTSTSSVKKAESFLLEKLARHEPVMLFGDMGFLPWFDFPKEYHFGGHTFVVCGFDDKKTALASDMDQNASGLKRGFYYPLSLEQLRKARGSLFKPFPPQNRYLEFNFKDFHDPKGEDIFSAIRQTIEFHLAPPIKNMGVKGLRHTAKEILKWPQVFKNRELRMNLFNLYIFIEIGGTGGGCFRYIYARFLKEAAEIVANQALTTAAAMFNESGKKFSEIGLMFKDALTMNNINAQIEIASHKFSKIADIEEQSYAFLRENM